MDKAKLSRATGKRARSSSEEEEKGPAQQTIKSYFSAKDSKIKTTSSHFVQKDETKVIHSNASKNGKTRASLQSNKSNTEIQHFTKIMEQNGALPRNEKANEDRIMSLTLAHGFPSPSVNNNIVNDLKPPAPACWSGGKKIFSCEWVQM